MEDAEIAVAFLVTQVIRESQPGFGGSSETSDGAVADALHILSVLVKTNLGPGLPLDQMRHEVQQTTNLRPRTRARITVALEEAVASDAAFAVRLREILSHLRKIIDETTITPTTIQTNISNQISGNVSGKILQANDIHGDITFH